MNIIQKKGGELAKYERFGVINNRSRQLSLHNNYYVYFMKLTNGLHPSTPSARLRYKIAQPSASPGFPHNARKPGD